MKDFGDTPDQSLAVRSRQMGGDQGVSPASTCSRPCCPVCGAEEVPAFTPRTVYACGSSDYDQRPGTLRVKCENGGALGPATHGGGQPEES